MIFRQFASVLFVVVATSLVDSGFAKPAKHQKGTRSRQFIYPRESESIQDALDKASENTVTRLRPGDYSIVKKEIRSTACVFPKTTSN